MYGGEELASHEPTVVNQTNPFPLARSHRRTIALAHVPPRVRVTSVGRNLCLWDTRFRVWTAHTSVLAIVSSSLTLSVWIERATARAFACRSPWVSHVLRLLERQLKCRSHVESAPMILINAVRPFRDRVCRRRSRSPERVVPLREQEDGACGRGTRDSRPVAGRIRSRNSFECR